MPVYRAAMNAPNDPRPSLQHPDDDPYLWLEDVDGAQALAWVEARNAETLARYGDAAFARDRDSARAILDRPDRIPFVSRRGGLLYNFWTDAEHPRGLWRRTDAASFRSESPAWDILLDLDALSASEGEDWIWGGSSILKDGHDRALLSLSRGGGDAKVVREFDLTTRTFVADGFVLPDAKGGAAWLDRDTLLVSSAYGDGMATRAGYARTVRILSRGSDPLGAAVLFEVPETSMGAWGSVDRETGVERLVFVEQIGFFDTKIRLGDRGGARTPLDLPPDADVQIDRDYLAVRPRQPWILSGTEHATDTVLAIALSGFLAGSRDFAVLWRPDERRALQDMFWSAGRLFVHALDDLRPTYTVCTPRDEAWTARPVDGLPPLGSVRVWPLDAESEESDGTLLATVHDPVTPTTLLSISPDLGAPTVLRRTPPAFDAQGLRVTRHEAISADGTRVPYVQTGPDGLSGEAPVHMTAYGGFRLPLLPGYQPVLGKLWLERGGTSVVANIRGGGEFGTGWHDAGRREGKARAHDDFAAVAADLVARGVTRPGRIAAEGGSNGGLLIANMLTRYPERFGALFCTIPLIDMRRYTKLLAGASWIAEYGDPDDPQDWAFLGAISAYHTVEAGRPYPPILLATSRRDDRVHPGHARKMARKLNALGYDAAFYEPASGGHGYGKDNAETAAFLALGLNFLRSSIGWAAADA
jgi:prolyl oligopeptidase